MNKKLMIIPTIVLSSTLLLTGCTSGNSTPNNPAQPSSSSSASASEDSAQTQVDTQYVAPPEKLDDKYKGFYYAPTTVNEDAWEYYKSIGSTTYKEDSTVRSISTEEWDSARNDDKDYAKFDKMYGEVSSDVEQTALNVSSYLEKNPSATVEDINGNKELIISRYENLGSTGIEKDSSTGYYFAVFNMKDTSKGVTYGILVPQKGITPDFK